MGAQLADGRPGGDELVVRPLQGHELVVRSLLDHVASRHDGDDVRVLDGGQAVGDDDTGATFSCFVQCVLDRLAEEGEKKKERNACRCIAKIKQAGNDEVVMELGILIMA